MEDNLETPKRGERERERESFEICAGGTGMLLNHQRTRYGVGRKVHFRTFADTTTNGGKLLLLFFFFLKTWLY